MKKQVATKNAFSEMQSEYRKKFDDATKELHHLEGSFVLATGYYPTNPNDGHFANLLDYQQRMCKAFWSTEQVRRVVEAGNTAYALSSVFFDCYADTDKQN